MKKSLRVYFLTATVLLVFAISVVNPLSALADDSTPVAPTSPPTSNTSTTSSTSADTSASTQSSSPANTSDPSGTSAPATSVAPANTSAPADSSAAPTSVAPASTSASAASANTTVVSPENKSAPATPVASIDLTIGAATDTSVAPTEPSASKTPVASTDTTVATTDTTAPATTAAPSAATVATVLSQVPAGTSVVALDATGTAVPLATQAAADIIQTGDPEWCPAGKLPGDASCTASYGAFNGGSGLLSDLKSNPATYSGNGTIYIASDYQPALTSGSVDVGGVTIDGNTLQGGGANGALGDLTLQGGWDFGLNSLSSSQNYTNFGSNPLTVKNWYGNVTINDIYFSNVPTGNGLTVLVTSGNIKVHHVHSDNNLLAGAQLDNSPGTGSSISVDGNSEFNGNTGNGITAFSGKNGDITLTDVTANGNLGYGTYISNVYSGATGGNITIDPSTFNNNGKDGLNVSSIGSIMLTEVVADDNTANGAYLDNSGGGFGNIIIDSSIFSDNQTTGRGLIAHSNHDISLNDVTASDNGGGGAELNNSFGTGSILLTGNNTFNDNGYNLDPSVGLYAVSNFDVNLNGITALGNGYQGSSGLGGGAFMATDFGNLSIANSVFSMNCTYCELGFGFVAFSGGDTTLQGVTADSNGNNDPKNTGSTALGGLIFSDSDVSVTNSNFSGNCVFGDCAGGGIEVLSSGTGNLVSFDDVTANGNGAATGSGGGGALISSGGNIDINCSTFNNNVGVGVETDTPSGSTITLNGVTLDGNTSGATDITGGILVSSTGNCGSGSKGTTPIVGGPIIPVTGGSLNIINVPDSGGQGYALDCTQYSGTELVLPNGDHVLLPCPIGNNAALTHVANNKLPGPVDSKFTFVSAMDSEVTPSPLNGTAMVSFTIPSGKQGAHFTILHWDGTKWVNLGGSATPPGYFSVSTNLTGDFVLVTQ